MSGLQAADRPSAEIGLHGPMENATPHRTMKPDSEKLVALALQVQTNGELYERKPMIDGGMSTWWC